MFFQKSLHPCALDKSSLSIETMNLFAAGGLFGMMTKMTETMANGYSCDSTLQKLSNKYQHNRV